MGSMLGLGGRKRRLDETAARECQSAAASCHHFAATLPLGELFSLGLAGRPRPRAPPARPLLLQAGHSHIGSLIFNLLPAK